MLAALVRKNFSQALIGEREIALENRRPSREELGRRFEGIDELGIYLHIPFCRQICPYCPYNKEIYCPEMAQRYAHAVTKEIDIYAGMVGPRPVTSLYIGGGSPTTMLHHDLAGILERIHDLFNVHCEVHMESHLNDLSDENLDTIESLGVRHLSVGVEALQDRHLKFLKRPYTAAIARQAVQRAVSRDFKCVNVDLMFALPDQSCGEIDQAANSLVELGVDQVATYPLFRFPYTLMGGNGKTNNYRLGMVFKRRRMLKVLEKAFYSAGYERSSVWAFTRPAVPRYCSVTVPLYLGLGASGGSYLRDLFYLNTFSVAEYIKSIEEKGTAIALSLELSERMQMAGWLYWRIYETRFDRKDFLMRFRQSVDEIYGKYFKALELVGFSTDDGQRITLTDRGAYWLHAFEDLFSIEYISRLWGTSRQEPWPRRVPL